MLFRLRIVLLALVLLTYSAGPVLAPARADDAQELPHALFTTAAGAEVRLSLEMADTPEKQSRGLMFRTELPEDVGMIFIFPGETRVGFWMKNTLLPLSIAFITSEGKIIDILDMQPQTETVHTPQANYRYAIEVNQGYYARHGIAIGDTVTFSPEIQ